jgi:enoyl-[acyl-carrier protein] reductase II
MENRLKKLFSIDIPVIQAGMVWCSGWKLASAVSNAGGLGLIGSGSMYPEILREHIQKCKKNTRRTFGVNVPLLYPDIDKHIEIIIEEKVPVVFTSAGNPSIWTSKLKDHGIIVVHVVSNLKFARKAEASGVDAIVVEGFEAGGHNGREETTTFCLLQIVRSETNLPLIAAGGIGTGRGILGALAMGADGVQIGSRFAASEESSAHEKFKQKIVQAEEGETVFTLKALTPVRLIKNHFYEKVKELESKGGSVEEFKLLLGKGRAKKGIFEGDLEEGELEIGQISAAIHDVKPAARILSDLWNEFLIEKDRFCKKTY